MGVERDVGLVELAHHRGHGQALAVELAQAGAAELAAVAFFQRLVEEEAVQKGRMRRVDAHLEGLQPVAVPQALEGKAVRGRRGKAVEGGEGRGRHVFGPEPAEQHAGLLQQRVAALLDALAQRAAGGLAGVSRHRPAASNFQPWKGQRRPSPSLRPKDRSAPRCGQSRSSRPKLPSAFVNSTKSCPSRRTAFTGRTPMAGSSAGLNSSTSATGCQ